MKSPSKDYISIQMSQSDVIIHKFRISPINLKLQCGSSSVITEKVSMEEFRNGELHQNIEFYFGQLTLEHMINLANGKLDLFSHLPRKLLLKILNELSIEDLFSVSLTTKFFQNLCNDDIVWINKNKESGIDFNPELKKLGHEIGFKNLYFMNKIERQRRLRKIRESQTFLTES